MMIKMLHAVLALMILAQPVFAQEIREADVESIDRAEKYLQDMKTAQARFVQTTHDGTQLVGTFYMQRPGKLRFEYDPPVENFVVADGTFIYFYDAELEEQTNAPIKATLANFFLRKNFSFTDDLIVKDAKFAGGLLQIKVVQADEPEAGSITFAFGEKPFDLKKWRHALQDAAENVKDCGVCGNLDMADPCGICRNEKRDERQICVVSQVSDVWAIERTAAFKGRYHVLGGLLSALDGIGPQDLRIDKLAQRIAQNKGQVEEVILGLAATVDGQSTAHYISDQITPLGVKVSHLAHGMPVGGELDYLDDGTITTALRSRA